MADNVVFEDNRLKVNAEMQDAIIAFLYEVCGEYQSQTARNTRVDTGQTKGSWDYAIDENALEGIIGSPMENAIWEEFGTGEYALEGNGRKDGWYYVDKDGKGHFTYGKKPNRALFNAHEKLKSKVPKALEQKLKGLK